MNCTSRHVAPLKTRLVMTQMNDRFFKPWTNIRTQPNEITRIPTPVSAPKMNDIESMVYWKGAGVFGDWHIGSRRARGCGPRMAS